MMYGYGWGWTWMILMPLVWLALLAAIVWAVVRLTQQPGAEGHGRRREAPLEILDRRYASGEIDDDAYTRARARLLGPEVGPP